MNVMITGLKMPKRCPINALIYPDGRAIITLHSGKTMECRAEEAADVRSVVHGEWMSGDYRNVSAICSNCGHLRLGNGAEWATKLAFFCEKCGADMRKKEET